MIPEYLNVIGKVPAPCTESCMDVLPTIVAAEATLYLATSTYYPQTDDLFSSTTHMVHVVETVAAWVEMAAAIGWTITW